MARKRETHTQYDRVERKFGETIAAIAIGMADSKLYQAAYKVAQESGSGFVEFYEVAWEAGVTLEEYAENSGIEWGVDYEWIDSVDEFVDMILTYTIKNGYFPSKRQVYVDMLKIVLD